MIPLSLCLKLHYEVKRGGTFGISYHAYELLHIYTSIFVRRSTYYVDRAFLIIKWSIYTNQMCTF